MQATVARSAEFLETFAKHNLVCDGAMGTMLYSKGIFISRSFDELNLSNPQLIRDVHSEYVQAGADIIETNTFGANRTKLMSHGLAEQTHDINLQGARIAREAAGTPIVVVRGSDGKVRAFRNACRHRGMQVASGTGCARAFVCRYHGWTYNLEGRLRHIPHEEGFPGFDKEAHPLVPVTASERFGLVFVTQDSPALGDDSLEGLARLIGPDQRLFATAEREFEVNWKILLEGFIEGYHIKSTHPESFLPYGFDNLNVIDLFGRHSRVTYPFQRIRKLAKVPPAERRVEGLLTYVYHLFPNVLVTVLSRHTNVVVLEPLMPGPLLLTLTRRPA